MEISWPFAAQSALLGVGLAMDAFSVSMVNGLAEPDMRRSRRLLIAGTFAFFQWMMPMIGWLCVHTIAESFHAFQSFIPWIALLLLGFIGGKMIYEGLQKRGAGAEQAEPRQVGFGALMMQGVATSIDALSVGFTIADYGVSMALAASLIIAIVTLVICLAGIRIGRTVGTKLSGKADILGGMILILIGLRIIIGHLAGF